MELWYTSSIAFPMKLLLDFFRGFAFVLVLLYTLCSADPTFTQVAPPITPDSLKRDVPEFYKIFGRATPFDVHPDETPFSPKPKPQYFARTGVLGTAKITASTSRLAGGIIYSPD